MHSVIVILGPTASGKSKLGVRLAKQFHGVVISADSRQVYRGLTVGSGALVRQEQGGVPHFLLGTASPRSQYSVARFVTDVHRILKKLPESTPIFLVGGSPFYITAVTDPGSFSSVPPNPVVRRRLEKKTTAQLLALLKKKSPVRARTIDPANRRRLIRALEIADAPAVSGPVLPSRRILKIGLRVPQTTLFRRIDRQIVQRLKKGMAREILHLRRQGLSWARIEALGLEYRVVARYMQGQIPNSQLIPAMQSVTHDFVRRQMTWWKRDKKITWMASPRQVEAKVKKFLQA